MTRRAGRRRPRRSPPATARGPRRAGSGRTARPSTPNRRSARVMIASPVSPSASKSPKTRTRSPRSRAARQPRQEHVGVRQQRAGRAGRRADRRTRRPARRAVGRRRGPRAAPPARVEIPSSRRRARPASRRAPRRSGKVQRKRGSTTASGCHEGLHRGSTGRVRRAASGRRAPDPRAAGRGQPAVPAVVPELPVDEQRARDEDRRVGPRDDPDQQRQDEVAGSPRRRTGAARAASGRRSGWS